MIYLGDYLGHIMSEVTKARMSADIEAVRIAELYASHPLMKNMPIPRFRMPTIEMDVPVLIRDIDDKHSDGRDTKPDIEKLHESLKMTVTKIITEEKVRISRDNMVKLLNKLKLDLEEQYKPSEIPVSEKRLAKKLAFTLGSTIKESSRVSDEKLNTLRSRLEIEGFASFEKIKRKPPRLSVFITSSELKESGNKDNTAVLRLKINEEAYEWTSVETEEGQEDKLVIE